MKKRTTIIGALLSLLPLGQPLVIGTGAALTSAAMILSVPEKAQAESADFYYNKGMLKHYLEEDYSGAISDYTKAIEINPRYAKAYLNRGSAKSGLTDYSGAISDYSKAIEINPRYPNAYLNRGIAKDKLKDYYGAISDYTKAIEINPKYSEAYSNRGISKGQGFQDNKGACDDFKKAASLGNEYRINWLKDERGSWCRDM
tara:strand:- start:224 stop:826 length:603 start_codon:yes stop_codon:yes gene_type:complete